MDSEKLSYNIYHIMSYHNRRAPHEGLQLLGIFEEDLTFCPSLQTMSPSQKKYATFILCGYKDLFCTMNEESSIFKYVTLIKGI